MLMQLASHFWRPDFSPAQATALIADYAEDLADCTLVEIEIAIRDYRLRPEIPGKMKPFPSSGTLRQLALDYRKHRAELARIGPAVSVKSRPLRWWTKPVSWWPKWSRDWKESEVPPGELVRDMPGDPLREPNRS